MLNGLFQSSSIPVLEEVISFAQARQSVLAGNIANIDTPGYQAKDLSVEDFQARLKQAIEERDDPGIRTPGEGDLPPKPLMAEVAKSSPTILRHDLGNVDMESQVAEMVKNEIQHNTALTIMTDQFHQLQVAISEKVQRMLSALDISTSGLVAQRMRMIQISNNIANIKSTHTSNGEKVPYQAKTVVFQADESQGSNGAAGVKVSSIAAVPAEPIWRPEPNHPDAQKAGPHAGEVAYPNIDLMVEFTNALEAARSYEANLGAIDITKNMEQQTLKILA